MQNKTGNSAETTPVTAEEQSSVESIEPPDSLNGESPSHISQDQSTRSNKIAGHIEYLDFEIEIKEGKRHQYPISVLNSPGGETSAIMSWPFTHASLAEELIQLETVLLRASTMRRRQLDPSEKTVQEFGTKLFDALIADEIRSLYDVSREKAFQQGCGLRIKLRISEPKLATLPWEYMYDARHDQYLGISSRTPIVRYLESQLPPRPLITAKPLRILGLASNPKDAPHIDSRQEKRRVETALRDLIKDGLVELKWTEGSSWRDLQRELLQGPWHVFHFIGHGYFDTSRDEGFIVLTDEHGDTDRLSATRLAQLLTDHHALRLALLNACDGAKASVRDTLSSTASILVRQGLPAVLAMQNEISNRAAVECARSFYQSIAFGYPVDAAAAEARKGMALDGRNSPEWGTPVLHMRSSNGRLLAAIRGAGHAANQPDAIQPLAKVDPSSSHSSHGSMRSRPPATPPLGLRQKHRRSLDAALPSLTLRTEKLGFGLTDRIPEQISRLWQPRFLQTERSAYLFHLRLVLLVLLGLFASVGVELLLGENIHRFVLALTGRTIPNWVGPLTHSVAWGAIGLLNLFTLRSHLSKYGRRVAAIPLLWAGVWAIGYVHQNLQQTIDIGSTLLVYYAALGLLVAAISQASGYPVVARTLTAQKWLQGRLPTLLTIAGSWFVLFRVTPELIRPWLLPQPTAVPDPQLYEMVSWASHWASSLGIALVSMNMGWLISGNMGPLYLAIVGIGWSLATELGAIQIFSRSPLAGHSLMAILLSLPLVLWLWSTEKQALYWQTKVDNAPNSQAALALLQERKQISAEDAGGYLQQASLNNLALAGYTLSGVDLRGTSLAGTDLTAANLHACNLRGADCRGATLDMANLTDADLRDAQLKGSSMMGTNLNGALYSDETSWPDGFDYRNSGAIGPGAILKQKTLSRIELSYCELQGVNFTGARLDYANLTGAQLEGVNFRGAILIGANLEDISFRRASFKGAIYNNQTIWPKGFSPEKRGAILLGEEVRS